jgi:hypothetical protein
MRSFGWVIYIFFLVVFVARPGLASDLGFGSSLFVESEIFDDTEDGVSFASEDLTAHNRSSKSRVNFSLYSRNRVAFRSYCDALQMDGRRDEFAEFLSSVKYDKNDCLACPTFFRIVQSACRSPILRSSITAPEALAPSRQREPHSEVINATLQLSNLLQSDEATALKTAVVISLMSGTLEQSREIPPGLRDYLSSLIDLWSNPFRQQLAKLEHQSKVNQAEPEISLSSGAKIRQLDSLFDF